MDNSEDQEVPRESPFLDTPKDCQCPDSIRGASKSLGITCQHLFRLAYVGSGYPESVSRAIFCLFIGSRFDENLIPITVRDFCERRPHVDDTHGRRGVSKCFGCSLTKNATAEMQSFYERIHPEITALTLLTHAKDPSSVIAPSKMVAELSEEERAWYDLVNSGALDTEETGWGDLVRGGDTI